MTQLRYYQTEAVNAVFHFWSEHPGNPLLVLPTGTGKSIVLAEVCRTALGWPGTKLLVVTHVRELVEQNFTQMVRLWPEAPAGINSAGLGRRDTRTDITFCSIQSVWRHADRFQKVDIVIVDEAHLIPRDAQTMYGRFLSDLWIINPYMKVVGLTATPFRLDSGRLDRGEGNMFDGIAYDYPIREAIDQGYLVPLVTRATTTALDVSGVKLQGGEFKAGDLEAAVDKEELNRAIVEETIARAGDRRSWLFFASGVDHAYHLRDLLVDRGVTCEVIHAATPSEERKAILQAFKAGKIRALASMNVLTTGFDAPGVDLIAMARPTKSAGLYIQMAGRGTRPVYGPGHDMTTAAGRLAAIAAGKANCLVLDFAGNIQRHGPIDMIDVKEKVKGEGEAPVKVCPECEMYVLAAARECPECGFLFPEPKPKYQALPTQAPILSQAPGALAPPEWAVVTDIRVARHEKPGKITSMRVTYVTRGQNFNEWVCFEHTGFARQKAEKWWRTYHGKAPIPGNVQEALVRTEAGELQWPAEILVRPRGEFHDVVGRRGVLDLRPGGEGVPF